MLRRQDHRVSGRCLGDADGTHGRQASRLESQEDIVLAPADVQRQLLQGVEHAVDGEEPNEMAGRSDRQLAEGQVVGRP